MNVKRLESIDLWKGIAILSVLHIHTVFYSGSLYLPDWTRSLALLLDIPVFFFISGFLLHNSKANLILQRMLRQLRRLVSDYLVVTIVTLILAVILYTLFRLEIEYNLHTAILSAIKVQPDDSIWDVFRVYGGSMWYLRVYVSVLPLAVLILASPLKRGVILLPFISYAIFILITLYPPLDQRFLLTDTRSAAFYLSLLLAGAAFKKNRNKFSTVGLSISWVVILGATLIILFFEGALPDLQEAKFPPSTLYLLFSMHSILAICLLVILETRNQLPKLPWRIQTFVAWCGRHTFRIYLWQGVAASLPLFFVPEMLERGIPPLVIFVVMLTWNIMVSLALTYLHNRLETVRVTSTSKEE